MRKVNVEFIEEGEIGCYYPEELSEIGVLFENGQVLVADDLGAVAIHNCVVHPEKSDWVIVNRLNDGEKDYTEDDPEYIVSLILSGGAAK